MYKHPDWLKTAMFYEIYPQTFFDNNNDGIGDLYGVIRKLDYIKDLGFNAIWLNPIFESPFFDAGYDVTDYKKVAKRYGGNKALTSLVEFAHEKSIKIILDLVPGHTSIYHKWFLESQKDEVNPYSNRYIWTKNVWDSPKDLNVIRGFSQRNAACITNFFSIQPALNYGFSKIENPDYEEPISGKGPQGTIAAIIDVIRFWLKQGVDGFRVDMAGWLVKRDPDMQGTVAVWKQVFSTVKEEFPEAAFVSEWNSPKNSLASGFDMDFLLQDEFSKYNSLLTRSHHPYFGFDDQEGDSRKYLEYYLDLYNFAKSQGSYLSLISGNHDTYRLGKYLKPEEAKFYYAFMYTMPNVPFFYYGDEIGMTYEEGLKSVEGGYQRTGSRSPMQWDSSYQAGFTKSANPYIKVNPNKKDVNAESQLREEDSLLNTVKKLLSLRKDHVALNNDADFKILFNQEGKEPLAYLRSKANENILVAFNPGKEDKQIPIERESLNTLYQIGNVNLANHLLALGKESLAIILVK